MKDIKAIPFRTPACDDHMDDNESDECPWCHIEKLEDALHQIRSWVHAYPRDVFIEPTKEQWALANRVLNAEDGCPSLSAISGSNMRHVCEGIQGIVDTAVQTGLPDDA